MKKLLLSSLIIFMAFVNMTSAQETPKVKLDLIYKMDHNAKGNPLPEIMMALKSKAKSAPQEDIDWALNSTRLDIARKTKVLYTNDGQTVKLPEDIKEINNSKNFKYITIVVDNYGDTKRQTELGKVNPDMLRIRRNIFYYTDLVNNNKDGRKYQDSLEYWKKQVLVHEQKVKNINDTYKNIKYAMLMRVEDGVVLWKRNDIEKARYISDNGKLTIATEDVFDPKVGHNICFYDQAGYQMNKVNSITGSKGFAAIANDGSIYCTATFENHGSILLAFNNEGKEIWRYQTRLGYPDGSSGGLAMSPQNNHIVAAISDKTLLFSGDGRLKAEFDITSYHPVFSVDEKYFVSHRKDTLYICNIEQLELNKLYIPGLSYGMCSGILPGNNYFILTVRGKSINDILFSYIINRSGDVIIDLPSASSLSPRGTMLKADNSVYNVEVRDEK